MRLKILALGLVVLLVAASASAAVCPLNAPGAQVQHVVYVQFDNTHFTRDNPNVPSDLEQMPHLLNFIRGNGTLLSNHHTPLISHTATDILTSLTGVYGDRHGVPVANSFRYFKPDGTSSLGVSFAYGPIRSSILRPPHPPIRSSTCLPPTARTLPRPGYHSRAPDEI